MLHHQIFQSKQRIVATVDRGEASGTADDVEAEVGVLEVSPYGSVFTVTAVGIEFDEESVTALAARLLADDPAHPDRVLAFVVPTGNGGFAARLTRAAEGRSNVRFFTTVAQARNWVTARAPVRTSARPSHRPARSWGWATAGAMVVAALVTTALISSALDLLLARKAPVAAEIYAPPTTAPAYTRSRNAGVRSVTPGAAARAESRTAAAADPQVARSETD